MRILLINVSSGVGSTGRICTKLADKYISEGNDVIIAYGRDGVPEKYQGISKRIGNDLDVLMHVLKSRLFDSSGYGSKKKTKAFIRWVKEWDPDVIHLHNIHGYYINIEILFCYLRTCKKKILWTLHDCWAFTGHCAYFDAVECQKWKTKCLECPQKGEYPSSYIDRSKRNYDKKKKLFTGIPDLTLITPSKWLKRIVKESFLKEYEVNVEYNTIDSNVFKPTPSDLRSRCGIIGKKIVLGVALPWDKRKGLQDFVLLSQLLNDDFVIIVVGVTEEQSNRIALPNESYRKEKIEKKIVEYKKIRDIVKVSIPSDALQEKVEKAAACIDESYNSSKRKGVYSVICIEKTDDAKQLAGLYSISDYFFNPTREDNYPTVNLEAEACGTPVITYDTGGCRETIKNPESKYI